jgi:hypothetical protein
MEGAEPGKFLYRCVRMDVKSSTATRRVRALAVAAVLLCALGALAPLLARQAGTPHSRIHAVKVVNVAAGDQYGATGRVDQPLVTTAAVQAPVRAAPPAERPVESTGRCATLSCSTATRGPPERS